MTDDATQMTGSTEQESTQPRPAGMPPLPPRSAGADMKPARPLRTVEDPVWWRYGAVPFLVLLMVAAAADMGVYCTRLGLGAGLACLLFTGAILLLRKDFTWGERLFLGGLAVVDCAALVISGSAINYLLNIILPFIIQFLPHRQEPVQPGRSFRSWWGFWLARRKTEEDGKHSSRARLRNAMPTLICLLVGAVLFITFLSIFASGNPVVEQVWEAIVETWNRLVSYLHISWDIVSHVLVWLVAVILFGFYTLRRPTAEAKTAPFAGERGAENAAGRTMLPHLPIFSLIGVDLAFLIATATDINYLWRGIVPEGVSHTEYLHDGAASITWASALAACLLVLLFRRNGGARRSIACKVAGYLLVIQTLLLAVSVYMRLYYQISDYGFTIRRILAAETMSLGFAGLVVLIFYMACSGSFWKYAKICLGTMGLMLVAFGICSPARMAGDLNLRYMASHPQWEFSTIDFDNGRFRLPENLAFAYHVYQRTPDAEFGNALRTRAVHVLSWQEQVEQSGEWKAWRYTTAEDAAIAREILDKVPYVPAEERRFYWW